jgi:hypothetical protein
MRLSIDRQGRGSKTRSRPVKVCRRSGRARTVAGAGRFGSTGGSVSGEGGRCRQGDGSAAGRRARPEDRLARQQVWPAARRRPRNHSPTGRQAERPAREPRAAANNQGRSKVAAEVGAPGPISAPAAGPDWRREALLSRDERAHAHRHNRHRCGRARTQGERRGRRGPLPIVSEEELLMHSSGVDCAWGRGNNSTASVLYVYYRYRMRERNASKIWSTVAGSGAPARTCSANSSEPPKTVRTCHGLPGGRGRTQ